MPTDQNNISSGRPAAAPVPTMGQAPPPQSGNALLEFADEERKDFAGGLSKEQEKDIGEATGSAIIFGGIEAAKPSPETESLNRLKNADVPDFLKTVGRPFVEGGAGRRAARMGLGAGAATYAGQRAISNFLDEEEDMYTGTAPSATPRQPSGEGRARQSTVPQNSPTAPQMDAGQQVSAGQPASSGRQMTIKKETGRDRKEASVVKEAKGGVFGAALNKGKKLFGMGEDVSMPSFEDALNEFKKRQDMGDAPTTESMSAEEATGRVEDLFGDMRMEAGQKMLDNDLGFQFRQSMREAGDSISSGIGDAGEALKRDGKTLAGAGIAAGAGLAGNYGYRATQPNVKLSPQERREQRRVERAAQNVGHPAGALAPQSQRMSPNRARVSPEVRGRQGQMQKQSSNNQFLGGQAEEGEQEKSAADEEGGFQLDNDSAGVGGRWQMELDPKDPYEMGIFSGKNDQTNAPVAATLGTGAAAASGAMTGAAVRGTTGQPTYTLPYRFAKNFPHVQSEMEELASGAKNYFSDSGLQEGSRRFATGFAKGNRLEDVVRNTGDAIKFKKVLPNAALGALGGAGLAVGTDVASNLAQYGTGHAVSGGVDAPPVEPNLEAAGEAAQTAYDKGKGLAEDLSKTSAVSEAVDAQSAKREDGLDASTINMISGGSGGLLGVGGALAGGRLSRALSASSAGAFAAGPVYNALREGGPDVQSQLGLGEEKTGAFQKEGARKLDDLETKEENGTTKARYYGRWLPVDQPVESWRDGKKRAVLASKEVDGDKRVKLVHYGSSDHKHNYNENAKQNYLSRARGITDGKGNPTKDDPHSANHWAIKDLWPEDADADESARYDLADVTKEAAGDEEKAQLGAGLAGAGAGGAAYGVGQSIESGSDRFLGVDEEGANSIRKMREVAEGTPGAGAAQKYFSAGSDLIGNERFANPLTGNKITGRSAMKTIQKTPLSDYIGSTDHYDAFSKGPIPAFTHYYGENFDDVNRGFTGAVGGSRAVAANTEGMDLADAIKNSFDQRAEQASLSAEMPESEAKKLSLDVQSHDSTDVRPSAQSPDLVAEGANDYSRIGLETDEMLGPLRMSEYVTTKDVQNMNLVDRAQEIGYDVSTKDELFDLPRVDQKAILNPDTGGSGGARTPLHRYSLMEMSQITKGNADRYYNPLLKAPLRFREGMQQAAPYLRRGGAAAGTLGLLGAGYGAYNVANENAGGAEKTGSRKKKESGVKTADDEFTGADALSSSSLAASGIGAAQWGLAHREKSQIDDIANQAKELSERSDQIPLREAKDLASQEGFQGQVNFAGGMEKSMFNKDWIKTDVQPDSQELNIDVAGTYLGDGRFNLQQPQFLHELGHFKDFQRTGGRFDDFRDRHLSAQANDAGPINDLFGWTSDSPQLEGERRAWENAENLKKRLLGGNFGDHERALRDKLLTTYEKTDELNRYTRNSNRLFMLGGGLGVLGMGARIAEGPQDKTGSLEKVGDVTTDLRPHQERIRGRLQEQNGLVAAHDMGSGKTLSAISTLEDARQENPESMLRVLTPASLRENFRKEVDKHTDGGITGGTPEPKSHTKATLEGPQNEAADMRVVDEAHRARSTGSKFKKRLRETPAEKNLLMTGTPVYNHPHEIAPLVNIAAGESLLPETKSRFETKFVREEEEYPSGLSGLAYRVTGGSPGIRKKLEEGKESLRKPLREYVDFYEPDRDNENYPDVEEEEVKVPMSKRQKDAYRYMFKDLPMHLRWKVQSNLPPDKDERGKMMKFLNGPRQVATSINAFDEDASDLEAGQDSPKIQEVAEAVDDSSKRQVVYSNFLESGLDPLRAVLDEKGVDYGEYTGSTSQSKREEDVRRFNEGELSTLVMSSAGGEGLDLDAVNEIHVMEPHWNEQKINQVVARADRYKSHEDLPEDEREVRVKRYVSELPERSVSNALRSAFGGDQQMTGSVEEYIQDLAKKKQELSDQLIQLLEEETESIKKEGDDVLNPAETVLGAVEKLRKQVYGDIDKDSEELREMARQADEETPDRERLEDLFGEKVRLHGSQGLGINVPGDKSDIDVTIPTDSEDEYERKIEEVREQFSDLDPSPYNKFRDGVYVMSGTVDDEDMDVVVGHGPHVDERVESFDRAREELDPEDRGRIIEEKRRLKNALILSKPRYKRYKRKIDHELEIPRL